jgi:uncharacterized protein (DUF58 family)
VSEPTEIRWRPSRLALSFATSAAASLALAVIAGRWQLIIFVAPLLGVLAVPQWHRPHSRVRVHATPPLVRCFESEDARFTVAVQPTASDAVLQLRAPEVAGLEVDLAPGHSDRATLCVRAQRWGRYRVPVEVAAVSRSGFFIGTATVPVGELFVFPIADPQTTQLPRAQLPARIGTHLTRHRGPGVEYADIRAYVPGDQLRTVNWRVSARRGRLHVTDRLTDRAAEVIVLIDTYQQALGPATEATQRCARGATQVVQSALQSGDRAGIIALGNHSRWLGPDVGRRQFYRILDIILDASAGQPTRGTLAPRAALPPHAIVVAFSTLLETQFVLALNDLRTRGHPVVVVDVLAGSPFTDDLDPIITHWWTLARAGMYRDMASLGIDVVNWSEHISLEHVMHLLTQRSRQRR